MKAGILVLLGVLVLIFLFLSLPWLLIFIGLKTLPDPPLPKVKYGEFPFRLEYDIDGQRRVIQDTLIVEYDGIGMNEGNGKFRKWEQRLKSGKENITLLKVNNSFEIYYPPGSARYYMDDLEDYVEYKHSFPDAEFIERDGEITRYGIVYAEELLDKYQIKLISWEHTQPIENSFLETD
ncbi:hypothetical protein [Paenibacillus xylanexedens]|uniref:hypothetical protein n=1 Tax=Paenibacillus xylanexedens TaxID=528191 RepID=UPI0011A0D5EA|nr:hypothetical protein [Paenibacillus xylanexedens]